MGWVGADSEKFNPPWSGRGRAGTLPLPDRPVGEPLRWFVRRTGHMSTIHKKYLSNRIEVHRRGYNTLVNTYAISYAAKFIFCHRASISKLCTSPDRLCTVIRMDKPGPVPPCGTRSLSEVDALEAGVIEGDKGNQPPCCCTCFRSYSKFDMIFEVVIDRLRIESTYQCACCRIPWLTTLRLDQEVPQLFWIQNREACYSRLTKDFPSDHLYHQSMELNIWEICDPCVQLAFVYCYTKIRLT